MYHYVNGDLGMMPSGSFTRDKSRWMAFDNDDPGYFAETGLKPYGATRWGVFVDTDTGRTFKTER